MLRALSNQAKKSWHRHWKRALWIVALCACLPVFYVLSLGPAVFIFTRFKLEDRPMGNAMRAFYSPLKNYADNNPDRPEVKLLERYVDLCGD